MATTSSNARNTTLGLCYTFYRCFNCITYYMDIYSYVFINMNTQTIIELLKISSEIIDILDNRDEMPNSDFQGCIEAQIQKAYLIGKQEGGEIIK